MKHYTLKVNQFSRAIPWISNGLLLLLLWTAARGLYKVFPERGALNSDAYWTYLPSARKFLESPWNFLTTDPASYHVAPLGYIWPALWGGDQIYTQLANCGLFLITTVLIWHFMQITGGRLAALISCIILVGHPDLKNHTSNVLTESLYLFGFSLTMFAIAKAIFSRGQTKWLALMSTGLSITMLTRPVLQYILLLAVVTCIILSLKNNWKAHSKKLVTALLAALVLPAAIIVKNGVYFDVWSIGTGSGSGIFYGLSPHRNGAEPVYSNFSYDADVIPYTVDSATKGHPLDKKSDFINKTTALEIVKQTRLGDNIEFLYEKFRMWLFTSTPELYINYKLRWIRTSEWLIILSSITLVAWRRKHIDPSTLSGDIKNSRTRFWLFSGTLIGLAAMATQLTPILYNTRYASYFIEPWMIILTGWSTGYLIQTKPWPDSRLPAWLTGCFILVFAIYLAYVWTQHSIRREKWEINPNRPGPTEVIIPSRDLKKTSSEGMNLTEKGIWEFTEPYAVLHIAMNDIEIPNRDQVQDAIWRMQFSLQVPGKKSSSHCAKARISATPHQPEVNWYTPPPIIFVRTDGQDHTYMISANGANRPQGDRAKISIIFQCPPGSQLIWHGIEMRQSTLTKAAVEFLQNQTPMDPYLSVPLESQQQTLQPQLSL